MTAKRIEANGTDTLQLGNGQLSINQSTGEVTVGATGFSGKHRLISNLQLYVAGPVGTDGPVLQLSTQTTEGSMTGGIAFTESSEAAPNGVNAGIYYDGLANTLNIVGSALGSSLANSLETASKYMVMERDTGKTTFTITSSTTGSGLSGTVVSLTAAASAGTGALRIYAPNITNANTELQLFCEGTAVGYLQYIKSNSRLYASSATSLSGPYIASGGTSWTTGSDLRLKNILPEQVQGLNTVLSLNPIKYTRKSIENDSIHLGFIAQEVLPLIPEVVVGSGTEEDMYGINYGAITPVLVKAIQELASLRSDDANRIAELAAKLDAAEARIKQLEDR